MYFSQFMNRLALDHDLHKEVNGTTNTINMMLPLGTHCTVSYPELDYTARSRIHAGCFALPIDRHGRDRFVAKMLQFNRNAISVLDAGFANDANDCRLYTMTWQVPKKQQTLAAWHSNMASFEGLVTMAAKDLERMVREWASSAH